MKHQQQRGVALVVTLILLSVITFLAVAFLALTRRDKAAVNVSLSQTDARFMADTALARAEAELVSRMIAKGTLLNYDLMVTRNYINPNGFQTGVSNLLNVNYYYPDGEMVSSNSFDDHIINVGNLFYDPRPPVYITTNVNKEPLDFRFYVDFNRNRQFDTNGVLPVRDDNGIPIGTNVALTIGDPEWIGILEKPQYPHSGTNRFIGRYAYLVAPEGKSLDINFIHNYAKKNGNNGNMGANDEGFYRNSGVGSWEINLAAFLQELNTNMYVLNPQYQYETNVANGSPGKAFEDAYDVLRYRYGNANLPSAQDSLDNPNLTEVPNLTQIFQNDRVDLYTDGPLSQTAFQSNFVLAVDQDDPTRPWPGSKNPKIYRDIQELFDPTKSSPDFVTRLTQTTSSNSSYNRSTISRLLTQIGTSSDVDNYYVVNGQRYPKIHLNYDNLVQTNGLKIKHQTNFFEWEPLAFFTNAAEALIQKSLIRPNQDVYYLGGPVRTNFSLTNIMVYPTNEYTPSVHRLLQLAANIAGARTNSIHEGTNANFPIVFRPQFSRNAGATEIFISGYEEVHTNGLQQYDEGFRDLAYPENRDEVSEYPSKSDVNIAGIPWVISAKKGLPNFNEFSLETTIQITRKMELWKQGGGTAEQMFNRAPNETNLMYLVGITNYIGAEFWNSYTSAFNGQINIRFTNFIQAAITNESGVALLTGIPTTNRAAIFGFDKQLTTWPGAITNRLLNSESFVVERTNATFVKESSYLSNPVGFYPVTNEFQRRRPLFVPDWDLLITNQVTAIVTHESGRVLDFVNLGKVVTHIDVNKELFGEDLLNPLGGAGEPNLVHALWRTNRLGGPNGPTEGMLKQIEISLGNIDPRSLWKDYNPKARNDISVECQIDQFRYFMGETPVYGCTSLSPTNRIQVPFSPTRTIYLKNTLQANDPLVHYMPGDLVEPKKTSVSRAIIPPTRPYHQISASESSLGKVNDRYNPWGGKRDPLQSTGSGVDGTSFDPSIKDPLVRWSDDWDFPTNKFPNVGWLGRVHRGTPWQTFYLKSLNIESNAWFQWAGSGDTHPTRDWALSDVFTAAPNDNAARGLLSVNQTNQAAWSAVLSGVVVLSNSLPNDSPLLDALKSPQFEPLVIEPNSIQLSNIVAGINRHRTNFPNGVFSSPAEVFSTPELTAVSPFLNVTNQTKQQQFGINDNAYERIPQQILSLLKVGHPRVAVYSYGQALRPAPNSIVFNPPNGRPDLQNVCTNYQITGEVLTRTVLRVEGTPQNPKAVVESFQILQED